jgi:hypothetical protein
MQSCPSRLLLQRMRRGLVVTAICCAEEAKDAGGQYRGHEHC